MFIMGIECDLSPTAEVLVIERFLSTHVKTQKALDDM
jgi:hypothetical protein